MKILKCDHSILIKATCTKQYFPVMLFITLYKVVLTTCSGHTCKGPLVGAGTLRMPSTETTAELFAMVLY